MTSNLLKIEKIYILAINHSQEKYDSILNRLNTLGLPPQIPYEILQGHNAYESPIPGGMSVYDNWAIEGSNNLYWKYPVQTGEIGCTISHINAWKKVVEDGANRVLILEEDFYGIHLISDLKEPNYAWDFMYFGRYAFDESENVDIDDQWTIPGFSYNMHAYMLTNEGAKKLVDYHLERNIFINDEFINATFTKHRRDDIERMYPNKNIKAISTKINYINQSSTAKTSLVSKHTYDENQIEKNQMNNYIEILDTSDWNAWVSKYINPAISRKEYELMIDELGPSIVEFSLFTTKFCEEFIQLAESKGTWTLGRHEFYPTNDMLMDVIGMKEIYSRVIKEFVAPLATWYWTLEGEGWDEMVDETFIIRYRADMQGHLALHHDYSQYTIAVKLNDEFEGGGTYFPAYKLVANPKRVGNAILHPGLVSHRHGGRPVLSGTRYINVSFIKNPKIMR